jgi:anti-sigma factor RsiW
MTCESWSAKLDAYFDGELDTVESGTVQGHLRQCTVCSAKALEKLQMKLAMRAAGGKFVPNPALRARVQAGLRARRSTGWKVGWLPILASAAVWLIVGLLFVRDRDGRAERQLISELADVHVATLASANPVDVVSSDRHTVKPWFEGKIPFTFNLPESQGQPFVLVGGRVSYLRQSPGAELIFRVRQHQISVFIFQEQQLGKVADGSTSALSFGIRSWSHNGLNYFLIGDASPQDLDKLVEMLKAAG